MTSIGERAVRGVVIVLVACASACARPATEAAPSAPATTMESAGGNGLDVGASDIVSADGELAIALDAGASCDMLAPLRDRICGLAERLCTLSAESPDDADMRAQCEDGARRCLSATEGVRNRCGP